MCPWNTQLQSFIEWLEKVVRYRQVNGAGALNWVIALYLIQKIKGCKFQGISINLKRKMIKESYL